MLKIDPQSWHEVREGGKRKYILREGVLKIGLTLFVVFTLADLTSANGVTLFSLLTGIVIFGLGGYIAGAAVWSINEAEYKRHGKL